MAFGRGGRPGIFHVDSNAADALDFQEIVSRLRALHAADWAVEAARTTVCTISPRWTMPRDCPT